MKYIKKSPLFFMILLSSIIVLGMKVWKNTSFHQIYDLISASSIGIEETVSGNETSEEIIAENPTEAVEESISENQVAKVYEFEPVNNSYFEDALFIGDSRTVGLSMYSELKEPTYYAEVGLTIHKLMEAKIAPLEETEQPPTKENMISVEEALQNFSFGKIYLMVGINELGRGNAETFLEEYRTVVNRIRALQPNATIFVQAIMHVSEEKSSTDPVFNNTNIEQRNQALKTLEDKQHVFYLDMNEVVCDENGNLIKDYSFDGVHLKAKYYKLWEEFLKTHGINRESS